MLQDEVLLIEYELQSKENLPCFCVKILPVKYEQPKYKQSEENLPRFCVKLVKIVHQKLVNLGTDFTLVQDYRCLN